MRCCYNCGDGDLALAWPAAALWVQVQINPFVGEL